MRRKVKIKKENFVFPEAKRRTCFKGENGQFAKCCSEVKKDTDWKLTIEFADIKVIG